jgi:endonuclease-3
MKNIAKIMAGLRKTVRGFDGPAVSLVIAQHGRDPYFILVSCLLSLRTKDSISLPASLELFQSVKNFDDLVALPREDLEKIIYSTGFYRQKAKQLQAVAREIILHHGGKVPNTREALLALPGVGLKTANLVLAEAFGIPALCVDIHVHRISNRLGLIATRTPEETERALQKVLPKEYWPEWNNLLVVFGQNICTPQSPHCSTCPLAKLCPRVGVTRSR